MNKTIWNRFLESWSDNRKSKIQNRKLAGLFATVIALTACGARVEAQQPKKLPSIGYLTGATTEGQVSRIDAFRQGLRELGYIEGKNIVVEYRYAAENRDRLPALASELVRLKVDVIVTGGGGITRTAKEATNTIPIVMTQDGDPVANGFVVSLARPGGNITGLSNLSPEISGKQLELLKEIVPKLARVVILGGPVNSPGNAQQLKEVEVAAAAFKMKLQYLTILSPTDIEAAFRTATKELADAVVVQQGPIFNSNRRQIVKLAFKSRLPAIYSHSQYVLEGGLMTYGPSLPDLDRRAAVYVDKILRGARPADLPIEQPTKFELVINLRTAKQIGLTIPPNVLARADKIIK